MSSLLQQIKSLDINKQDTLTPGDNISIVDNVISSTASGSGTTNPVVSFKARGVSSATSGIAPYNTIIFNYGSGYDATTFKFTVPYEGVYLFYYTYGTAVDGDTVIMNLKRTRNSVTTVEKNTFLDNVIADTDHTETFTMFCEVGDEVFVESQSTRFKLSFNKSWFGGFLTGDTSSGITQAQLDTKQDTLTAGDNITITGDVISSTGGITQAQLDTKQDTLTAGDNITITGDVISSTGGITQAQLDTKQDVITSTTNISSNTLNTVAGVSVGGALSIGGIDLDTKIETATSGKQDALTAGTNITIDANNVISSTASGGSGITQAQLDTKQDILTAGDNITIVDNVISASGGGGGASFVGYRVYTTTGTHRTLLLNQTLTVDFDEGGNYNNSGTDRGYFIAPTNGFYSFKGKILLPSGSNARSYVRFFIDRGLGREPYEDFYDLVPATNNALLRGASGTCIAKLNEGDKFTIGLENPATSEIGTEVVTIVFSGYRISTF
jgi:hypothetical protein